ncbi:MAG: ABC transporter substrate-binding protein [Actinomycetota bacterium]|nr:ABC transporter substrate-binding protein [Actinomycetota bacterium]
MQPASPDAGNGASGGNTLRRFGPVAAIAAVIVVVVGIIVFAGGGDDDDETADSAEAGQPSETTAGDDTDATAGGDDDTDEGGDATAEGGDAPEPVDAISWTQAQEEGLDVTFPDTCDTERGQVAIPYYYASECYADVDDNGGATHTGVTEDTISVVYYSAPDSDPVLDFIQGPIQNDDTSAQVAETVQGFADLFNDYYQTYGRTVEVHVVDASGSSTDEVAARADAQRAIEEHQPFAAWGGPALTNAWADEMAAAGVVCIGCGLTGSEEYRAERAPFLINIVMAGNQVNLHGAEYVSKKLAGQPAAFAGDPAFQETERVFGHVYITSNEESERNAEQYRTLLSERGVELTEQLSYQLDPGRLPEQATSVIAKLKESGVTTVILQADPVAPANFTQEATAQEYFPEWVVTGGTLTDTTTFGRVFDQEQWDSAFGITTGAAETAPEIDPGFALYEWYTGAPPPADETAPILYATPALFFSGLGSAGPVLTPETFRDGLFAGEPTPSGITSSSLSWGQHGLWDELELENDWSGIDDATEWWWDADATGPDELQREGTGMVRFVDGGRRYLPGSWTEELRVFEEEGSVTIIEEPPADETPPEYPRP